MRLPVTLESVESFGSWVASALGEGKVPRVGGDPGRSVEGGLEGTVAPSCRTDDPHL